VSISSLLDDARAALSDVAREALGELREPRRVLGIARPARIVRVGDAWHLGVLLLGPEKLFATGEVIRARQEAPRGYTAESQRARAELAGAARRGGFAEGETVHIGWRMLDPDEATSGAASDPLVMTDGVPSVRWSAAGGYVPLHAYLRERVELLTNPPQGA
jgi:hypothetical protein